MTRTATKLQRFSRTLVVRLDAALLRRIRAGIRRLDPPMRLSEWVREVLREAVASLPSNQKGTSHEEDTD